MAGPQPNGIFLARPEEPFEGKRLAVKDLFDTAGLTTTYGSIIYADHVPERSAEAVTRLEAAGYANVGKTNLHEFAYGITSVNPHFGTVPEPARIRDGWPEGRAAARRRRSRPGSRTYALGTDSGGSIRIPAACCGIVGFKPSYGLVSLDGVLSARAELRPRRADGGLGRRVRGDAAGARRRLRARAARLARGARGRRRVARPGGSSGAARESARRRSSSRGGARSTFRSRSGSGPCSCARPPTSIATCSPSSPTPTATTCGRRSSAAWRSPTASTRPGCAPAPSSRSGPRRRSRGSTSS